MHIETMAVSALRPNPNNARTHSRKQIRQIANSIERFGFCNPVLIDDDNQIIAGHGRVEGAKLLNINELPTVRLSHLSEDDKRAYILADNQLAMKSGYDREILAIELQHLIDVGFDVELTGFATAELDLLMEDISDDGAVADVVPPLAKGPAVTLKGDLWLLGNHRLLCADAREASAYERLLGREQAEFVFTDPPYNVAVPGNVSGLGRVRHDNFAMASGEMTPEQFTTFLRAVFQQLCRFSVDGSIHQICIDWRHLREMLDAASGVYSELKNVCVWNKTNAGMGSFYRSKHELVFVWKNGMAPHINNFELGQHGRHRTNVWDYDGANVPGRAEELAMHPTVKPVALVADAIKDCSRRNGVVLDAFSGSGTVFIAAERTGRKARALEIDPAYVDVAIRRWQQFTGKSALLAPLEDSFEEVAEQRLVRARVPEVIP
jgi:DNA modification methylase